MTGLGSRGGLGVLGSRRRRGRHLAGDAHSHGSRTTSRASNSGELDAATRRLDAAHGASGRPRGSRQRPGDAAGDAAAQAQAARRNGSVAPGGGWRNGRTRRCALARVAARAYLDGGVDDALAMSAGRVLGQPCAARRAACAPDGIDLRPLCEAQLDIAARVNADDALGGPGRGETARRHAVAAFSRQQNGLPRLLARALVKTCPRDRWGRCGRGAPVGAPGVAIGISRDTGMLRSARRCAPEQIS